MPQQENSTRSTAQYIPVRTERFTQEKLTNAETALLELFNNSQYCDVNFRIKSGERVTHFSAHKLVLSIWSSVFTDLLVSNEDIEVTDIHPESFGAFLKFMYGSSEEIMENANNVKFILDLNALAKFYQVGKLREVCYGILNSIEVHEKNVFELLEVAILIDLESLKLRCIEVLQAQTAKILSSCDFKSITTSMIEVVLALPNLSLTSEYNLLTWVYDWAEYEYTRLSPNADNYKLKQKIIQPFLPYFNFLLLGTKSFATLVSSHREFFDEWECFSIFMNISCPGSVDLPLWYGKNRITRDYKTYKGAVVTGLTKKQEPSVRANVESTRHSSETSFVDCLISNPVHVDEGVSNLNGSENKELTCKNEEVNLIEIELIEQNCNDSSIDCMIAESKEEFIELQPKMDPGDHFLEDNHESKPASEWEITNFEKRKKQKKNKRMERKKK